jgi:cytochrome b6-f complex iron-sulfur subunit
MAHPDNRGLFLPPASAARLAEREQLDHAQQVRTGRRLFFRWLGWSAIGALVAQWTFGFASFFMPKRLGVFGGTIVAGVVGDYQVGDVKVFREGKCYVVRVPEGFLALWWKCPHLGCTVPWLPNDLAEGGPPDGGDRAFANKGRFKCPCHQSTYNRYGQIVFGPAPRPMSQFPLRVENGKIVVETGPNRAIIRDVAKGSDATPA